RDGGQSDQRQCAVAGPDRTGGRVRDAGAAGNGAADVLLRAGHRARGRGVDMRGPVAWWNDPWRPPRVLVAVTIGYLLWSLLPVLIAVLFSFNDGKSRTTWQGFSFRWYWGDQTRSVWHDATLHQA